MRNSIFAAIAALALAFGAGSAFAGESLDTLAGVAADAMTSAELAAVVGASDTFEHDGVPDAPQGQGGSTKTVAEQADSNGKGLARAESRADRGRSISFDHNN